MDPKSTPPPLGKVLRVSAEYAARSREGVRAALLDARAGSLTPPARDEHVRRFLYGFMAPLTLIRVAWQNKPIRGSIVRRLLPPLLLLALCTTVGVIDVVESLAAKHRDRAALVREAARAGEDEDDDDETPGVAAQEVRQADLEEAREEIRSAARNEVLKKSGALDVAAAAVSAAAAQADAAAARKAHAPSAPPPPPPPTGPLAVLAAMTKIAESKLAKLIATLGVIEWILIWIGREHHDVIAHDLADLTGVPSEPAPNPPKLRLDFGWIKLKGWRAIRFILFVALAAPTAWLLGRTPEVGAPLAVLVESAWVVYWASVFAIANTFLLGGDGGAGMGAVVRALARSARPHPRPRRDLPALRPHPHPRDEAGLARVQSVRGGAVGSGRARALAGDRRRAGALSPLAPRVRAGRHARLARVPAAGRRRARQPRHSRQPRGIRRSRPRTTDARVDLFTSYRRSG
jgi:hypothetical protein